jgi:APA family basic amino acid/polyamine antiporter
VPHRAQLAVGALVAGLVLVADVRGVIGFSSFAVLTYYAIANASAFTLPAEHRREPRAVAVVGLVGCVVLAFTLPATSLLGGVAALAIGVLGRFVRRWWRSRR